MYVSAPSGGKLGVEQNARGSGGGLLIVGLATGARRKHLKPNTLLFAARLCLNIVIAEPALTKFYLQQRRI